MATMIVQDEPQASAPSVPHIDYNTETTEAARALIGQIDRLNRLITEDDAEQVYLDSEHDRQTIELAQRHAQEQQALNEAHTNAVTLIAARRADRTAARDAYEAVVSGLQQKRGA